MPKWLGRMFTRGGIRHHQPEMGRELIRRNTGVTLVVRNVVCQPCNNEWMSRLQSNAKPLLEQMILGNRILIGPEAQRIIAAWATMTAMVMDFAEPPDPGPIYDQDQRTRFYHDRLIPAISHVWLAHRAALPATEVVGWRVDGSRISTTPIDPTASDLRQNVYVSTGVFAHLVLQLLVQRPEPGVPNIARLWSIEDEWGMRHVRFRVSPPEVPVAWPPPFPLQESELEPFAERWTRL